MAIKRRPLCVIFLLMMLIIYIMHISGLPLPGTYTPSDIISKTSSSGRNVRITGKVASRSVNDGSVSAVISNAHLTDDPSGQDLRNIKLYTDAAAEELVIGSIVSVYGSLSLNEKAPNPGGFDAYTYYAADDQWMSVSARRVTQISLPENMLPEYAATVKERLQENIMTMCGEDSGAVISAMILGEKSEISYELRSGYSVTGLSHLLAISGLHIGLIGMFIFRIMLRLKFKRGIASAISSVMLFGYCIFTGAAESSVRAFVMFTCLVAGQSLLKSYDSLSALSLAGIILLVRSPYTLFRPGFLLSFLAAAGLSVIYPVFLKRSGKENTAGGDKRVQPGPVKKLFLKALKTAKEGAMVWLSVQMAILPVLTACFYEICPYGLLTNIIFVPLTAVMMILSIFGSLISLISYQAGGIVMFIPKMIASFEGAAGDIMKKLPFARITAGQSEMQFVFIYYAALLILLVIIKKDFKPSKKVVLCAVCGVLMTGIFFKYKEGSYITALDVGQGDCFIIHTSDDRYFMSDGGSSDITDAGRYRIGAFLKAKGIRKLDGIFLSHEDDDHTNGVRQLFEDMLDGNIDLKTDHLFMSEIMSFTEKGEMLVDLAKKCGTETVFLSKGDLIKTEDFSFRVIFPASDDQVSGNDASLVLLFMQDRFTALFTGDIGMEPEEELLSGIRKTADGVLYVKAAHHGSKNSMSEEFLLELSPKICVISAPEHSFYGHPHAETLERLENCGISYFQTGLCGAVTAEIDDDGVKIKTYRD